MTNYELALQAIARVYEDEGSLENALENLQGLRDEIETLIESIETDIENKINQKED